MWTTVGVKRIVDASLFFFLLVFLKFFNRYSSYLGSHSLDGYNVFRL